LQIHGQPKPYFILKNKGSISPDIFVLAAYVSLKKRLPGMGGTCQAIFREETTISVSQNGLRPADFLVADTPNTNKSFVSALILPITRAIALKKD